jgi:hypothetical protein
MQLSVFIAWILVFFYFQSYSQALQNERKIDPTFKSLLAKQELDNKQKPLSHGKKKKKKSEVNSGTTNQNYECIIYTKNAKAVRDKGVVVNSILPTFVTATVSLAQIKQLSMMNEVSYIEASKNNYPNK